jgi:hypothetical protein
VCVRVRVCALICVSPRTWVNGHACMCVRVSAYVCVRLDALIGVRKKS